MPAGAAAGVAAADVAFDVATGGVAVKPAPGVTVRRDVRHPQVALWLLLLLLLEHRRRCFTCGICMIIHISHYCKFVIARVRSNLPAARELKFVASRVSLPVPEEKKTRPIMARAMTKTRTTLVSIG